MNENELIEKVKKLDARIQILENQSLRETPIINVKKKRLSPKEFLMTKSIKTGTEKVLVFAQYLENVNNVDSFNVGDLEQVFKLAKEKAPQNMNDAINKNIMRGFLVEAESKKDSKKAWELTITGVNHLVNNINKLK